VVIKVTNFYILPGDDNISTESVVIRTLVDFLFTGGTAAWFTNDTFQHSGDQIYVAMVRYVVETMEDLYII